MSLGWSSVTSVSRRDSSGDRDTNPVVLPRGRRVLGADSKDTTEHGGAERISAPGTQEEDQAC